MTPAARARLEKKLWTLSGEIGETIWANRDSGAEPEDERQLAERLQDVASEASRLAKSLLAKAPQERLFVPPRRYLSNTARTRK